MPEEVLPQGVKVYYGPFETQESGYGIVPAPFINISYTPVYSNDSVINITNKITLNGFVSQYAENSEAVINIASFESQDFGIQVDSGPTVISAESGDIGIATEDEKILLLELGASTVSAQYLRFTALKRRDGYASNIYGLNEFRIFNKDIEVPLSGSIVTCSGYSGTPLSNLVDGLNNTRVYPFSNPLIIEFDSVKLFDSYNFSYLNAPLGDPSYGDVPIRWTLEASDDGIIWTLIDSQNTDFVLEWPPETSGIVETIETVNIDIGNIEPETTWQITNIAEQNSPNIRRTLKNIKYLQSLLSHNGNTLTIRDTNGDVVLTAVGGILRSFSLQPGSNAWTQTVPFTAELDFSYINFFGESLSCATKWDTSVPSGNTILNDLNQYPLKSFNDSWSIGIDGESFAFFANSDNNQAVKISNNTITLSYTINAVGSDYYQENIDPPEFKPSWEIAKHFAQARLYDQVRGISSNILQISSSGECDPITTDSSGILSNLLSQYQIFNETISCSTSETEGSFTATYNSILKRKSFNNSAFDSDSAKHTISKNINYNSSDPGRLDINISIEGDIEGLILGGLINTPAAKFQLPRNGNLLIGASGSSKYSSAEALWNTISSGDDISNSFKNAIGITYNNIAGQGTSCNPANPQYPVARSFNLTRNKIDGTINYSIEYDNKCLISADSGNTSIIKNVEIDFTDKTPVFAEFKLPDSQTVLQDIKTFTAKEISYNITGRDNAYKISTSFSTLPTAFIINTALIDPDFPTLLTTIPDYSNFIVKNKTQNINILDGTYTINLTFVCASGCNI